MKNSVKKTMLAMFSSLALAAFFIIALGKPAAKVQAAAAGNYGYEALDNGTIEIRSYKGSDTELAIPDTIDGRTVTRIGYGAFEDCTGLKKVSIPSGVTYIGYSAFYHCGSLEEVTFPLGLTEIGSFAFYGCGSLREVEIPSSVASIGDAAFGWCDSLDRISVEAGNANYEIKDEMLYNISKWRGVRTLIWCPGKKTGVVTIPSDVYNIGAFAFSGCSHLEKIVIPSSVTYISRGTFSGCSGLPEVSIPSSVDAIGDYAFSGCSNLTEITIPSGVSYMGWHVFLDCDKLKAITVEVGNKYFLSENGLLYNKDKTELLCCPKGKTGTITIPSTVERVGYEHGTTCYGAFASGNSLDAILVEAGNANFVSENGILYNNGKTELVCYPGQKGDNLAIQSSVKRIGPYAFAGNGNLKDLTVPGTVSEVAYAAFRSCTALENAVLEEGVSNIGYDAFRDDDALKTATIPKSVESSTVNIRDHAFGYDKIKVLIYVKAGILPTIRCYSGSGGYYYAEKNGLPYVLLDQVATEEPAASSENNTADLAGSSSNGGTTATTAKPASTTASSGTTAGRRKTQTIYGGKRSKTLTVKQLKKKQRTFKIGARTTGNGKLTYKKLSGSSRLKVSKKGIVTVKKGTKKGTYKVKIRITAAQTGSYKKRIKTVTVKVQVKK